MSQIILMDYSPQYQKNDANGDNSRFDKRINNDNFIKSKFIRIQKNE